jgi:hypothetical protein
MDSPMLNAVNIFKQNWVRAASRESQRIVPREVCSCKGQENIHL